MGLNVELLESSFKLVAPQGDALVTRFYERLFEKYPAVKPLFKNASIPEQKKKLLASLVLVIQNIRRPEKLTPVLHDMGARHVGYGAKPAHYDAVGENLLAVLGEFAGEAWTPEVKQAWTDAYTAIKTIMLAGAKRAHHTQGEKTMSKATAKTKKTPAQTDMSGFYLGALEQSQNNILLCDRNLVITYANSTAKRTLAALESEIKKVLPKFNINTVVGTCIDEFHLDPSKQRRILADPGNMPHKADIQIGPLTLSLLVTAVMSQTGEYLGNALEWADVTEKRKMEQQALAMSKSQAVIEFNLDGTVVTANDNFLACLGYSLDEIKGKHHRMFADPAFANSLEYQALWTKLNRGEFDTGVYKRIAKGGREIWIQASYNPIFDASGKPYKVVKFATDITAQKQSQIDMEKLVAEAQAVLGRLASNDLTLEMTETYRGDLDKVKTSINAVVQNLTQTITTVREAVQAVSSGAEQITKGNEDLSQRTSEQASALEETSASMEEMTSTVKQNADNAKQANQLAIAARDIADKGGSVTVRAVEAMGERFGEAVAERYEQLRHDVERPLVKPARLFATPAELLQGLSAQACVKVSGLSADDRRARAPFTDAALDYFEDMDRVGGGGGTRTAGPFAGVAVAAGAGAGGMEAAVKMPSGMVASSESASGAAGEATVGEVGDDRRADDHRQAVDAGDPADLGVGEAEVAAEEDRQVGHVRADDRVHEEVVQADRGEGHGRRGAARWVAAWTAGDRVRGAGAWSRGGRERDGFAGGGARGSTRGGREGGQGCGGGGLGRGGREGGQGLRWWWAGSRGVSGRCVCGSGGAPGSTRGCRRGRGGSRPWGGSGGRGTSGGRAP